MDGDDGSKSAPRSPNRDDVLVFGTRQTLQSLQSFVRLGRAHVPHTEILWAIEAAASRRERDDDNRPGHAVSIVAPVNWNASR